MLEQTLRYQFALISSDPTNEQADEPSIQRDLLALFAAAAVPLKFKTPGRTIMTPLGKAVAWSSPAQTWQLVMYPTRVDLVFDAILFQEVNDSANVRSVTNVAQDIADSLAQVSAALGRKLTRVALIVGGESAQVGTDRVVKLFGLTDSVGEVPEATVRVNRSTRWELGGVKLRVNRIEAVEAASGEQVQSESQAQLIWNVDINTDPSSRDTMTEATVRAFFEKAAAQADEMLQRLAEAE